MKKVLFKWCALFDETMLQHSASVLHKFNEFKKVKESNPMQPFGSRDRPFSGEGPLGLYKPTLIHAHMTHNISLLYYLSSAKPTIINLLGFFTHDAIGTGQPAAINKQKSFVKRIGSQTMDKGDL